MMNLNKNIVIGVVAAAIVLVGVGFWYYQSKMTSNEASPPPPSAENANPSSVTNTSAPNVQVDNTSQINADLQKIDVGNVDKNFESVDKDINSL